jgi:hypothetical protein
MQSLASTPLFCGGLAHCANDSGDSSGSPSNLKLAVPVEVVALPAEGPLAPSEIVA